MYRHIYPYLALAFVPAAVLLLIAGVRALRINRRSGLNLKLALILNTSLVIVVGWFGHAKAEYPEVLCYIPPPIIDEPVPDAFDNSKGWNELEKTMVELER
jgi:hypothetical protein